MMHFLWIYVKYDPSLDSAIIWVDINFIQLFLIHLFYTIRISRNKQQQTIPTYELHFCITGILNFIILPKTRQSQ